MCCVRVVCFALVVLAALMVWAPIACSTACEAAAVSSSARRPSYAFSDLGFQTNVFSIYKVRFEVSILFFDTDGN